ncbi:MAG: right-handed parallel beta-helix repeat-containing protein [Lachnospiraceae bacterium]|nr:right-handed parallel beta-helix repeat-containing protein [Lachnospiraceae bacterium]
MDYHVAKTGNDSNSGTLEMPFLTIQKAADIMMAGDKAIVHEGVYRENVAPKNAGISRLRPITYEAADGEKVIIKGSEIISPDVWVKANETATVWQASIDNAIFNGFNPFEKLVWGDWLLSGEQKDVHLGEVYLNGRALYEAASIDEVFSPAVRTAYMNIFTETEVPELYPERMKYTWFAKIEGETTTIFANFQEYDPTKELVEINCRPACFYPERPGIDYLIVRGFEMCHAATPWTPPTADQPGLIGPRWSKGWIIEDNIIHDAKCSGISLGKVADSGDNYYSKRRDKPGYTYQLESVFTALEQGFSKERVGSHIVRRNHIYDCGQNGIVGHLGCVFSEIYDNHIHDISLKGEYFGWEIGGIKLHSAIDVKVRDNIIHDCVCGAWFDWQTQGTQISRNLFYDNGLDLFVEVSHGPYLVENNIMASSYALKNMSQGGAYVNNLFGGGLITFDVRQRATPYHLPHSTKVKGYAVIYGGDDRFYNNIFVGRGEGADYGTGYYDEFNTSLADFIHNIQKDAPVDIDRFIEEKEAVFIDFNLYLDGASAFAKEEHATDLSDFAANLRVEIKDGLNYLHIDLPDQFDSLTVPVKTTESLGRTRISDAEYEDSDGSELRIETDINGEKNTGRIGPLKALKSGSNRILIKHKRKDNYA